MGVDISGMLVRKPITLEDLTGRKIAIDAMNVLYQFLTIIRQPDGTPLRDSKGRVTSHFSGLFYRTIKLLEHGAKPCYVFDGVPPLFKSTTVEQRRAVKEEAQALHKEALAKGDMEEARKYAMMSTSMTDDIVADAKELLEAMGVPYVNAPSEGEAQAAAMAQRGEVWAVSSQDYDCLLFGAPTLLRNIAVGGKRKLPGKRVYVNVEPEMIRLDDTLRANGIDREQLVVLGVLIGTDFNPGGFRGIGPKKALELVKRKKTLAHALEGLEWRWDVSAHDVYEFFMNPPVTRDYTLKWREPDVNEIMRIMVSEHEFGRERIESAIKKLEDAKGRQERLDKWVKK
ncbi:MAG: flap endonuclease-1 [Candidatus Aenigmatarchaeota archaeon]|nr:MAG: flap endonuclease-1 [Candidatus Aenigmarchaeota archaeon]